MDYSYVGSNPSALNVNYLMKKNTYLFKTLSKLLQSKSIFIYSYRNLKSLDLKSLRKELKVYNLSIKLVRLNLLLKFLSKTPYKGLVNKLSNNVLFIYYDGDIKDFSFIHKLKVGYPSLDVLVYLHDKKVYLYDFISLSKNKDIKGVFNKMLNTIKLTPLLRLTSCLKLAAKKSAGIA